MGVFDVSMCKGTLHSGKVPYIPMYGVPYAGPDLGMGKLGSCPGASTTRGPPHIS